MTISRSQMNKQLKSAPAGSKGLKKLPTEVRNKMGFMSKGGTVMKSKGGAVKMSKGGAVKMAKGGAIKKMSKGGAVKMSKGGAVKMAKGGAIKKMNMGGRVGGMARRRRAT